MAYDMGLLAIALVAVRIFGKVIGLLGENVIGELIFLLFGVKSG